jgi:hypothetical protein
MRFVAMPFAGEEEDDGALPDIAPAGAIGLEKAFSLCNIYHLVFLENAAFGPRKIVVGRVPGAGIGCPGRNMG